MKNINQIQQGDVTAERIDKLPKNCKKIKADIRGIVLAEGEHTGHHHRLNNDSGVALMEAPSGEKYLVNETEEEVELRHEEHKPVKYGPGIWEIGVVNEQDHLQQLVRKVVD